jgi:hypothetical protein
MPQSKLPAYYYTNNIACKTAKGNFLNEVIINTIPKSHFLTLLPIRLKGKTP